MVAQKVIVVGTSAGGVDSLARFVEGLNPNIPASVFVVLHVPAEGSSHLPLILNRAGRLPASLPKDGEHSYARAWIQHTGEKTYSRRVKRNMMRKYYTTCS